MATEKRLIDAKGKFTLNAGDITGHIMCVENGYATVFDRFAKIVCKFSLLDAPTVDAVPVSDIRLHHIHIDNEGVPEVKLQIGDRYFIMRTDPVDAVKVVHGRWEYHDFYTGTQRSVFECNLCKGAFTGTVGFNYCPNCGAKMDLKG